MQESTISFKGITISSGKVAARVCVYAAHMQQKIIKANLAGEGACQSEWDRFEGAMATCSSELDKISSNVAAKLGAAEAEIFTAQKHIMTDSQVLAQLRRKVFDERKNIEWAIDEVYSAYEKQFSQFNDSYLADRANDIGEIKRRLLERLLNSRSGFLCQGQDKCTEGESKIIVAEALTAEMMVRMNLEHVKGIVTEHGGISSHAAIIARSVGIPCISGAHGILNHLKCGDTILVDGDKGRIILHPAQEVIERLIPAAATQDDEVCVIATPPGSKLYANASLIEDVRQASFVRADGIGLFRTEILFLRAERLLSIDEQFGFYSRVIDIMGDKPVTFRLLDVGGDKDLPFLHIEKESNPYLGWRGARFLLGNPGIFSSQVKALVRLSKRTKLRIMFPMIIDEQQLVRMCKGVRDIIATEQADAANIELGLMFEVPSACLAPRTLMEKVDFASIGSNDLIQYLFAVDRSNELVNSEYDPDHPLLWSVLQQLSDTARELSKSLSICGEMAGREGMPGRLLNIGIRELSVSPRLIPRVRNEMSGISQPRNQESVVA
ncbi:MAG: phosphoenolpyruvate--protein phosphotransferase [Chitinivibrionales bacterium]|nr:phosphoenolpyruvate--protein phosphotransferase [Chitinivibrionales bacterium]